MYWCCFFFAFHVRITIELPSNHIVFELDCVHAHCSHVCVRRWIAGWRRLAVIMVYIEIKLKSFCSCYIVWPNRFSVHLSNGSSNGGSRSEATLWKTIRPVSNQQCYSIAPSKWPANKTQKFFNRFTFSTFQNFFFFFCRATDKIKMWLKVVRRLRIRHHLNIWLWIRSRWPPDSIVPCSRSIPILWSLIFFVVVAASSAAIAIAIVTQNTNAEW